MASKPKSGPTTVDQDGEPSKMERQNLNSMNRISHTCSDLYYKTENGIHDYKTAAQLNRTLSTAFNVQKLKIDVAMKAGVTKELIAQIAGLPPSSIEKKKQEEEDKK